jgi:hypothetical protein
LRSQIREATLAGVIEIPKVRLDISLCRLENELSILVGQGVISEDQKAKILARFN